MLLSFWFFGGGGGSGGGGGGGGCGGFGETKRNVDVLLQTNKSKKKDKPLGLNGDC